MDSPAKKRGRPRKSDVVNNAEVEPKKKTKQLVEPKVENLLSKKTPTVAQRKAAKPKKKYKEVSSEDEYQDEETDEDFDEEEEGEPKSRRSSAAKRKSVAIQAKDETESWGNYRNTIDNGPVPAHALTLNEIAFDVALKVQHRNQERHLVIDYLEQNNSCEFILDAKITKQVLLDTHPVQLSSPANQAPCILSPLESSVHKDQTFTLNAGVGPIQSLDWLPMPTFGCPQTEQYLAVGCSRSSIVPKHFYDEIYTYKNYVQVWMFDLSNTKTAVSPEHHQLLGLIPIDNSGAIWSLKWSPASASPSRYLAAGTSSGSIYVHKVALKLVETSSSRQIFPCYRSSKSIRCLLPEPNHATQCLALDWSKHDPTRLAASYSNGYIALFHVNTNAKHLTEIKNNQEKIIHPIRLIRCSPTPIRDIKFLNDTANLVVIVANIAKRFCIWDFDDSHQQLIDIENSGTESVIRSLTGDLICVKEFTPSYARTSAYLAYDPESSNLPKHIYFQSTPDHVLSVDYSPWLDAALLCDSNGHVYFFRLTNFVRWTRKNECSLKYRLKLFNLTAVPKQEATSNGMSGVFFSSCDIGENKDEPVFEQSSYSDLVNKYYLDTNLSCDQKFVSKQDDFSKAGSYALNALHRIRFNPNLGSYGWSAFAGESGLLFLLPLNQSWSNHAKTIYDEENKSTS